MTSLLEITTRRTCRAGRGAARNAASPSCQMNGANRHSAERLRISRISPTV